MTLTYFNNPGWAKKQLPLGEPRIVSGKLDRYGQELQIVHPDHVLPPDEAAQIPEREAVYPLVGGPHQPSPRPISPARRWRARRSSPNGSSRA